MAYSWKENDYNTGTQVNVHNYESLYPLSYFNLTYQADSATRDPKKLLFKYTINQASTVNYQVHAIILYEEEVFVDKVADKLLIVEGLRKKYIIYNICVSKKVTTKVKL